MGFVKPSFEITAFHDCHDAASFPFIQEAEIIVRFATIELNENERF
jgi:hypothetical protein